jgi:murein L,D-transpeptidase YcbB/YkuD
LSALRSQASSRIDLIKSNLERWRWVPREFEARYVAVNVPEQSLVFVQDRNVALRSRVIVGRRSSTTPILRTSVRAVKANPPWNIPGDIAARDLLPYMRRNPNYLKERRMVLVDTLETDPYGHQIDWRAVEPSEFYYSVRQLPGPDTALGDLMLDMPNDFDVYLHDTPAKGLFAHADRTVSNGCVRVQEIYPLASLALTGDPDAGMARLNDAIATGETQILDLQNPLPVYLLYWTAVPSSEGGLTFPPDLYDRDDALIGALNGRRGAVLARTASVGMQVAANAD